MEFYNEGVMIDTMLVHRFSAEGLAQLLVELNQERDESRTWEGVKAEQELLDAFMPSLDDL